MDFGGGGFLSQAAGPQGGGGDDSDKKKRGGQVLIPLTIRMIQKCTIEEEAYMFEGRYGTQVKVIGNIQQVDAKDTRITYTLEDGTGQIQATVWTDQNEDDLPILSERRKAAIQGVYVAVTGKLKEHKGKHFISAFDVRPVEDFNEVTYHLLEAAHSYLKAKTAQPQQAQIKAASTTAPNANFMATNPQYNTGPAPMEFDAMAENGLTGAQNKILEYYNTNGTGDEGCLITTVIQAMAPFFDEQVCRQNIDVLISEGFLYSTIDDSFHKSTDSG